MENKILLVGKDRKYFFAERDYEGKTLKPTDEHILATDTMPYGFEFKFGGFDGEWFGLMGYLTHENSGLSHEEVGKKNLDLTVKGLNKIVKKNDADYVLIDNLSSRDISTSWGISGRAQLLIKR